ncbi:AAA family ATPase [Runella sp.]|jgi:energy-coupling factor transporter ATP-binding protein EcfA2|uniref:AAA family ATPase n=1 Tax=Runella sp. TaxID=1960881 RepID=UPI003015BC6C
MENQPNYIRSISLENVRCFGSKQTLYFTQNNQSDGEIAMWNVILGNNGTGKTTILKGISGLHVVFYDQKNVQWLKYGSYFSVKKSEEYGRMGMILNDFNGYRYVLNNFSLNVTLAGFIKEEPNDRDRNKAPLFAYGAARKIGTLGISEDLPDYTLSLFDEQAALLNAEKWLIDAEYLALKGEPQHQKRYELVKSTLQKLLKAEVSGFEIKTENNVAKVYFKTHYGEVRLHELSLGYKTLIAWVTDLASGLIDSYFISENPLAEPAICLVDEIDLHMHPQMQRNVMKFLRETFPKTQFICTAHSPLIVQSGEDANIILLRRKGDEVEVVNDVDDAKNWRIDQILDSDLFENTSSYPPTIEQKVNKRRAILLKDKPSKREKVELSKLDDSLDNLSVTESPEYLQALKILSKVQKNG